ncbi:MAG: long-chain fatty acid--CoA ligase [Candidatus Kapabacteria bacterium]|jgi:long-chain acyl-CoA synthetase|nr:long-chain fatty acid--CoA ligase [Candidatus Kapabacteria bacterium]
MKFTTVPEMFIKICDEFADSKTAYRYKVGEEYLDMSYEELRDKVECLAVGLLDLGVRAGDRIGIIAENSLSWILSDFAIISIGAIDVPVFPSLTAKQAEYVFNDCEAAVVIVSNSFQLNKILEIKPNMPNLRHIIVIDPDYKSSDLSVKTINGLIDRGSKLKDKDERRNLLIESVAIINPKDVFTIIYTSGTTGNPKGVMLTNENVMSNVTGVTDLDIIKHDDVFLSFLPLCHSYERTAGYYSPFSKGATVALAQSTETVATNIQEVSPTIMTTVPRLLEMIKKKVYAGVERGSGAKKKIFYWAVKTGIDYFYATQNNEVSYGLKKKYGIADKLVFSKIRAKTGGKLDRFVSGGAGLPIDVCEFFLAAGFRVLEGYGLTESSPVIAVNHPDSIEPGTVGPPFANVDVKIAEDGEVLARGLSIMKGYWNDPVATKVAIDEEGWLYTGDIGLITEKGNLKIVDRKKYLFVSTGGKNIAPQPIEQLLCQSAYIEHCVLLGDNRDYITALLTPDISMLKIVAENFDIKYDQDFELINHPKILTAMKQDIDRLQNDLSKHERVRKFHLLNESFTVESGELTPKLSVKRHVVERKYSFLIDKMYDIG